MSDINIHGVPNAGVGYSLTGKKIMVHDPAAPLASSTVMYPASSLGGGGNSYAAPIWREADGDLNIGDTTFSSALLIGATEMSFIIVNKVIEYVDEDFVFDNTTGEITRLNQWQVNDTLITPHKPA